MGSIRAACRLVSRTGRGLVCLQGHGRADGWLVSRLVRYKVRRLGGAMSVIGGKCGLVCWLVADKVGALGGFVGWLMSWFRILGFQGRLIGRVFRFWGGCRFPSGVLGDGVLGRFPGRML